MCGSHVPDQSQGRRSVLHKRHGLGTEFCLQKKREWMLGRLKDIPSWEYLFDGQIGRLGAGGTAGFELREAWVWLPELLAVCSGQVTWMTRTSRFSIIKWPEELPGVVRFSKMMKVYTHIWHCSWHITVSSRRLPLFPRD